MKVEVKNGKLIIEMDLQEPRPSRSGKTLVVATTSGIVKTAAEANGKPINLGVNAFINR